MYYEFYIDQFLLEHLLIGYLLIAASVSLQKKTVTRKRIAAGSIINAVLTTVLVCLGLPQWTIVSMPAALAAVYLGKSRREFGSGLFFLLFVTVCFGGSLEALLQLVKLPVMAGAVLCVMLLRGAGRWIRGRRMKLSGIATVELRWEDQTLRLRGMVDTGNRLTEPLSGRPVSIVDGVSAKKLLGEGWESRRGFYLIPYHSIGTDKGWMLGVTIDSLSVEAPEGRIDIQNPVLAIYEGQVSYRKQYQVILHPMHAGT